MTTEQQTKLADLQAKYEAAKKAYELELSDNNIGHVNSAAGKSVYPNGQAEPDVNKFQQWLTTSDRLLVVKKQVMQSAADDINSYIDLLDKITQNEFATSNPALYTDLVKNAQDKEKTLFAAKSTWYILGGVILIVVVIAGIIIYKRYKK